MDKKEANPRPEGLEASYRHGVGGGCFDPSGRGLSRRAASLAPNTTHSTSSSAPSYPSLLKTLKIQQLASPTPGYPGVNIRAMPVPASLTQCEFG